MTVDCNANPALHFTMHSAAAALVQQQSWNSSDNTAAVVSMRSLRTGARGDKWTKENELFAFLLFLLLFCIFMALVAITLRNLTSFAFSATLTAAMNT